jgi:hypothetical protein
LAFLNDAKGKEVTPSVVGQKVEYGEAVVNNDRRIAELERQYGAIDDSLPTPEMKPRKRKVSR